MAAFVGDGGGGDLMEAAVEKAFARYDADGNKAIDRTELAALCQSLGSPLTQEELTEALAQLDGDHNGTIEKGEFLKWWLEKDTKGAGTNPLRKKLSKVALTGEWRRRGGRSRGEGICLALAGRPDQNSGKAGPRGGRCAGSRVAGRVACVVPVHYTLRPGKLAYRLFCCCLLRCYQPPTNCWIFVVRTYPARSLARSGCNEAMHYYMDEMYEQRDKLHVEILKETEDKAKIEKTIDTLTERLATLNKSIAVNRASMEEFDGLLKQTETAYMSIVDGTSTLLNVLTRYSD